VYLEVDDDEQWHRAQARAVTDAATTFTMTKADLDAWRPLFEPPDDAELQGATIDDPPDGFDTWEAWVAEWWPTSLDG
jgi:hypothetical protein